MTATHQKQMEFFFANTESKMKSAKCSEDSEQKEEKTHYTFVFFAWFELERQTRTDD